jgi:glutaryl-CoA transferase
MSAWLPVRTDDSSLPLRGLHVLDLSRILAGPFATMVLSDLGADVIKVERPGTGDDTRRWGPPFLMGESTYFLAVNRNRRSITLNLDSEEGRAILGQLAADAHVVVENFLPQQLQSLGLETLQKDHPHLAWVSIRASSSEGPLGQSPGFDAMVQARSGLMSITGHEFATKVGVAISDVVAGLHAAIGALALLIEKGFRPERAGDASVVEVPLLECTLSALVNQAANYLLAGVVPERLGNEHPNLAPYASFACEDGEIFVGAGTDRQFKRLADAIGQPDIVEDPRFATNAARLSNRHELNALIAEPLRSRSRSAWGERFDVAGVPWAPVNDIAEAFNEDHVQAIGLVANVPRNRSFIAQVRSPFKIDGARPEPRMAPPALGEHTFDILENLGHDRGRIHHLREAGVV